ncbi:MAG: glycosyltransferase family 4 protein [Burkholderiaceae bacterium]|nr:glycosyltransferase family 4 protein [Burkholderiaceae bacterium]
MSSKRPPLIYLACPWHPFGGGMFKVTDYLVQHQSVDDSPARLCPLDTRGGGHVAMSLYYMPKAMATLLWRRLTGRLAGVHINMAERASAARKGLLVVYARLIGARVLIHMHAAQMHHVYRGMPGWGQALLRWVFSLAHEVVVLGDAARSFVLQDLHCDPARVHSVINGVPGPRLPRRAEGSQDKLRVLFLGNLLERKGLSDLLQAFTRIRTPADRWQATVAGGGDVDGYRAKSAALGLEPQVSFFGWARQDQAAELLSQADVLVLPSYDEGLPLVILEALAHGVAVVCTPVGEIPHTLEDGKHALFVQPGDVDGIAAALDRLMAEPELRRKLEREGHATYRERFSMHAFFDAVAQVHQRVFGISARFDEAGSARGHGG